jgi:uncharacterized iron-regulated protein
MMYQPAYGRDSTAQQRFLEDLLRLQRGVHEGLQEQVLEFTGGNSPALERYTRNYLREFQRYQALSGFPELYEQVRASDLIYIGDYHTLRQSQEMALQVLEQAATADRPLVLAVEMIQSSHQTHLDAYWRGEIDEREFLERVEYTETWNFRWDNYRPLFTAARQHGVRMVAINQPGETGQERIQRRDARIADRLVAVITEDPRARILVLIGDLHLASAHLPRAVDKRLVQQGVQRSRLVIHQNSDELYWDLARSGNEDGTQVVRLSDDRFCVMQVPPYVKLQSYLSWEHAADDPEGDIDMLDLFDPTQSRIVERLLENLCGFLQLPDVAPPADLFTNLDESFFDAVDAADLSQAQQEELHLQAFANRSCWIAEIDAVYLPYFSVNHAAEASMLVLLDRLSSDYGMQGDVYEDFYVRCLRNAFAFLASKLINPRRVVSGEDEIRRFLRKAVRRLHEPQLIFRKRVARFVVQHKDLERSQEGLEPQGRLKQIYEESLDIQLEVTFQLGAMLGEAMAAALQQGGFDRDHLRQHLLAMEEMPASERYFRLLQQTQAFA